jgi:tetratricopeptide (TPR) repeat protein
MLIYENPAIRQISATTLRWIFTHFDPELYIPLTFLSYQIDYSIAGQSPWFYHLHSLLLHIAGSILAGWVMVRLTGSRRVGMFCGLLFLLHPLQTEAVAWASGRKDVLSGMFFFGSLLTYFAWLHGEKRSRYYTSLILLLLGLLAKVMVATLPAVALLCVWASGRLRLQRLLELLPFFALSVLFVLIGMLGKHNLIGATPMTTKIFMAFYSTAFYLGKIFWPRHFSVLYPYTGTVEFLSSAFILCAAIVLGLLLTVRLCWQRQRMISVGILWYLITIAPTYMNLGVKGEMDMYFASDRYAYIPSIGIFLAFAALLSSASSALAEWLKMQRAFVQRSCAAIILLPLAFVTQQQSMVWKNTETLFRNVIAYFPASSHVAYNNLGNMERLRGNLDTAIEHYQRALELRQHSKTWSNLGAAYRRKKMYTEARNAYSSALTLDYQSPYAHFGLGILQAEMGEIPAAENSYIKAIELEPLYEEVYVNLGALLHRQGKEEEALRRLNEAIDINPLFPDAHYNRAVVLSALGRLQEAIEAYEYALDLNPSSLHARINLGILLAHEGDLNQAREQFHAILQIDPKNAAARSALEQLQ